MKYEGYCAIGLTTFESRAVNGGYIFSGKREDGSYCFAAKAYIQILNKSSLSFKVFPKLSANPIVQLETTGQVTCFDTGLPDSLPIKIYILYQNIAENQRLKNRDLHTIVIEKDGVFEYANDIEICGSSNIIYEEESKCVYGKSRIETFSEVIIRERVVL